MEVEKTRGVNIVIGSVTFGIHVAPIVTHFSHCSPDIKLYVFSSHALVRFVTNQTMDRVPRLFMERVALCLDFDSVQEGRMVSFPWGNAFISAKYNIHTLCIYVGDENTKKLYAVAQPTWSDCDIKAVPFDSVHQKFITHFKIEPIMPWSNRLRTWREISLVQMQRLVRSIGSSLSLGPSEQRHPLRYNEKSSNCLRLHRSNQWITQELLSLRVPIVSVYIESDIDPHVAEDFFRNTGPLYHAIHQRNLPSSTLDALINNFVPVDGGRLNLMSLLSKEQLERLVMKCEMSGRMVSLQVSAEKGSIHSYVTDFFDFDKFYSLKQVRQRSLVAFREGADVEVYVSMYGYSRLEWHWQSARL
uniref:Tudor domain-containing protein n=1 Tax=Steinernema glaseri TaxID=37863 RepID=A0A1I7Z0W3_9BILA